MRKVLISFVAFTYMYLNLKSQIFQDDGRLIGDLTTTDVCNHFIPFHTSFNIENGGEAKVGGYADAIVGASYTNLSTVNTSGIYKRNFQINLSYINSEYGGGTDDCGSQAKFSNIRYETELNFPNTHSQWDVSMDISHKGSKFLYSISTFTLEIQNNNTGFISTQNVILNCNPSSGFSGLGIGLINNLVPGTYHIKVIFPYYDNNHTRFSKTNKQGNINLLFNFLITGH